MFDKIIIPANEIHSKYLTLWPKDVFHKKGPYLIEVYPKGIKITRHVNQKSIILGSLPSPQTKSGSSVASGQGLKSIEDMEPIIKITEESDYPLRVLFDYVSAISLNGELHIELVNDKISYSLYFNKNQ